LRPIADLRASKRDRELREEFFETLGSAVFEELDAIDAKLMGRHSLAIARFEQHLLPDEGTVRKIVRYQQMLYRERDRCMDQLERKQARRRANEYRDSEPLDDSLPDGGKSAAWAEVRTSRALLLTEQRSTRCADKPFARRRKTDK